MEQIFMNVAHQVPAAGMDRPARVQALSKMIEDTAQSNHISQGYLWDQGSLEPLLRIKIFMLALNTCFSLLIVTICYPRMAEE